MRWATEKRNVDDARLGDNGRMNWLARYLCLIRVHPHACVNNVTKLEDPRTPFFAMPSLYRSSRGGTG